VDPAKLRHGLLHGLGGYRGRAPCSRPPKPILLPGPAFRPARSTAGSTGFSDYFVLWTTFCLSVRSVIGDGLALGTAALTVRQREAVRVRAQPARTR
jgi:hypothetical protein